MTYTDRVRDFLCDDLTRISEHLSLYDLLDALWASLWNKALYTQK